MGKDDGPNVDERITLERMIDFRYVGQVRALSVPVGASEFTPNCPTVLSPQQRSPPSRIRQT